MTLRGRAAALGASAALLVLAACSGGTSDGSGGAPRGAPDGAPRTGQDTASQEAGARGPAEAVEGADVGGTITVYHPDDAGPGTLDPAAGSSRTGTAIQRALTSRSLTQYVRDGEGRPVLVPDLATDLGTPNRDYTRWTFTIRDDATWEDGRPVTAEEVAFGICRSLDSATFPSGPGTAYFRTYLAGARGYEGPYTGKDAGCEQWGGVSVEGQDVIITTAAPVPDMGHWGALPAMGAVPLGRSSRPPAYGKNPLSNGPYKIERFEPHDELVLVRNDEWSAASDPGRHQYADGFVLRFDQDQAEVDELMLAGGGASRTAISTSLGAEQYNDAVDQLGDRLVQQTSPCVSALAPDYTRIIDLDVRKALAYAYPYQDAWIAAGEVPGGTRLAANSITPPDMAGKKDFQVDNDQITYDPVRSRRLLAEAGRRGKPYRITMAYDDRDPRAVAVQEQVTKGLEEGGFSVKAIPVRRSLPRIWTDRGNGINQRLDVRGIEVCADWPTGSAVLPRLLGGSGADNSAYFDEPAVDQEMDEIARLPLEEQADAWGALDEKIMTEYFPVVPTAFRDELLVFGSGIGNPTGDGSTGAPNYKDLYVVQ